MDQLVDECRLFGILRNSLRQDLVACHGFSNPDAGAILNWFDPSGPEYLKHVDDWQQWLCAAVREDPALPPSLSPKNMFGYYSIHKLPSNWVNAIHQVAKLFYKWHGVPRRKTNMDEVKNRLRQARPVTLDGFEIEGIRNELSWLVAPDMNSAIGRFGPGATYEGFNPVQKWTRVGKIPDVPPAFFRVNSRDPWSSSPFGDGITKIAEVPKSIKCNRIVSSEPAMYMYAQLAVNDAIVSQLHRHWPQHIMLDNQERHNEALSWDKACSIDLSDASDYVSCELVQAVLPQLWPVLAKVRSTYSVFPDGEEVLLRTFAPMGSGVCFSCMTTVLAGILSYASKVVAKERRARTWWHVYGDDIIVPVEMYDYVLMLLDRAGLVVNRAKSCCTLIYRESCGRELFWDDNITPAYIRDPLSIVPASKVEQICQTLSDKAFLKTAEVVAELSGCIRSMRYNRNYQRSEVCVRTTSARQKIRSLDGWDGLNRWFSVHTQGNSWDKRRPSGVAAEVWTKPAWRFHASQDYPYLTTWLVTRR
jgi:hypothetical protein